MNFVFRPSTIDDYQLYESCLDNREFLFMLYNGEHIDINQYIRKETNVIKLISLLDTSQGLVKIGFCHFYHKIGTNQYTFVGGIKPLLFNKGLGLYSSVAILNCLFQSSLQKLEIKSGVYKHNPRSSRMLKSIGFKLSASGHDKYVLTLNSADFYNDFVQKILSKVTGEIESL